MIKPALDEGTQRVAQPGAFVVPYAIMAPLVALLMAMTGWNFTLNARLTALETVAASPSKYDAQFAALTTKLADFQEMYERDRINDRVIDSRQGKP